jgi:hypothetical protein
VYANQSATRLWGKNGDPNAVADGLRWLARSAREIGAARVDVA